MDARYWVIVLIAVFAIFMLVLILYDRKARKKIGYLSEEIQRLQKERQENIDALEEQIREYEDPFGEPTAEAAAERITGDPAVDSLLSDMERVCREKDVRLQCRIAVVPQGLMEKRQLCSLLGNLLDNAIEAASQVHGQVQVESRIVRGQWVLITENSKSPDLAPLANGMRSTKRGEGHGIGSKIIDQLVAQADGYIDRKDLGDRFRIFIAVPIGDEL